MGCGRRWVVGLAIGPLSKCILQSLQIFNNKLLARASEVGPLLKEGRKDIVESSARSLWRMAGGSCGEWRKIVEENGRISC